MCTYVPRQRFLRQLALFRLRPAIFPPKLQWSVIRTSRPTAINKYPVFEREAGFAPPVTELCVALAVVIDAGPGPVLASLVDIVARLDAAASDALMDDSIEFAMAR